MVNTSAIQLPDSAEQAEDFAARGFPSLTAALSFFLVAKLLKISLHVAGAIALPKFRLSQSLTAARTVLSAASYFSAIWVSTIETSAILIGVGSLIDMLHEYLGAIIDVLLTRCGRHTRMYNYRVSALNHTHYMDRNAAFVTIVLGEMVAGLLYNAADYDGAVGLSPFYGRAICALITAFCVNWTYFTGEYGRLKRHPLRRHPFISITLQSCIGPCAPR